MSRIGRKPIDIPGGVEISVKPGEVTVKGPKGELVQEISPDMTVKVDGDVVTVERPTDRGPHRALHGLTRSLVANMIEGVTNGYEKTLEIQGVGYRAAAKGRDLELALGYSHPVSPADRSGRARDRQAESRTDRGEYPRESSARALQGQGNSLPRRACREEGR